jgi:7-cyano-7-deazaguanine synthase
MKIVLIYSGGLDSTTLLYYLRADGHQVRALSFNYGQRHARELVAAQAITARLGVEHVVMDLATLGRDLLTGSSQTDPTVEVPEGHYAEESMKATVVPGRNLIMASIGLGWAASMKSDAIALGVHSGDHAIYPDCRPEWVDALRRISRINDWHPVELMTPFIRWSKGEIARMALRLNVPIDETWTCYKGEAVPCGKCGSCVERAEALDEARGGS